MLGIQNTPCSSLRPRAVLCTCKTGCSASDGYPAYLGRESSSLRSTQGLVADEPGGYRCKARCTEARLMRTMGCGALYVAVNVSPLYPTVRSPVHRPTWSSAASKPRRDQPEGGGLYLRCHMERIRVCSFCDRCVCTKNRRMAGCCIDEDGAGSGCPSASPVLLQRRETKYLLRNNLIIIMYYLSSIM